MLDTIPTLVGSIIGVLIFSAIFLHTYGIGKYVLAWMGLARLGNTFVQAWITNSSVVILKQD